MRAKKNPIVPESIFRDHWNYACEKIYFDIKYVNDEQK